VGRGRRGSSGLGTSNTASQRATVRKAAARVAEVVFYTGRAAPYKKHSGCASASHAGLDGRRAKLCLLLSCRHLAAIEAAVTMRP